jgi:AraC family transcriptional regulator, mar-sox-rob regulon activator
MQPMQSAIHPQARRPAHTNTPLRNDTQYRTTDRVLQILLGGDLSRLRVDSVARQLGMSATTLRRRLRLDHTHYQFLLDRARQYRCEQALQATWQPGSKQFLSRLQALDRSRLQCLEGPAALIGPPGGATAPATGG